MIAFAAIPQLIDYGACVAAGVKKVFVIPICSVDFQKINGNLPNFYNPDYQTFTRPLPLLKAPIRADLWQEITAYARTQNLERAAEALDDFRIWDIKIGRFVYENLQSGQTMDVLNQKQNLAVLTQYADTKKMDGFWYNPIFKKIVPTDLIPMRIKALRTTSSTRTSAEAQSVAFEIQGRQRNESIGAAFDLQLINNRFYIYG